jgi:Cu/Ag efflux protein CusF
MLKRLTSVLICLTALSVMAVGAAHAQRGGGGGGGGRGGGGGGGSHSEDSPSPAAPLPVQKPMNQLVIVGVVKAIDTETKQITIAYDPVDALNWPAGAQPFPVAKSAMLGQVTVGEKVRFTLDSNQIATIKDFNAPSDNPKRASTPLPTGGL